VNPSGAILIVRPALLTLGAPERVAFSGAAVGPWRRGVQRPPDRPMGVAGV